MHGGSKHAIEALSDALRMELKQFGINVVVVQPSFVSTEINVTKHMATSGGAIADYATLESELTTYHSKCILIKPWQLRSSPRA